MEKFREVTSVTTENLTTDDVITIVKTRTYNVKTWEELTREEKEKEIEKNCNGIYEWYQENIYENFKYDLEYMKEKHKNIQFDDIYVDSNSQGAWIDRVKDFKYLSEDITIYGEYIDIYDIDLHIRKYIEPITENDINIYTYNVSYDLFEKIKKTKKYQNWINNIITDVNNWIEDVNRICEYVIENECRYPWNLDDEEDLQNLADYFMDIEFITDEEIDFESEV